MKWPQRLAVVAAVVGTGMLVAAPAAHAAPDGGKAQFSNRAYIVQMAESPVSAYTGGIKGYAATKPGKGQKIDA